MTAMILRRTLHDVSNRAFPNPVQSRLSRGASPALLVNESLGRILVTAKTFEITRGPIH